MLERVLDIQSLLVKSYFWLSICRIRLQDPDEDDDEHHCSIVISLMRTDRKRTPANDKPPIGFAIYKVTKIGDVFIFNVVPRCAQMANERGTKHVKDV